MTASVLMGIDVGTSGVKVVLSDLEGHLVRDGVARYPTDTGTSGEGAEQDATAWWEALTRITREVVGEERVAGIAVTSQAPTLVPVTAAGDPVGPALTWLDRRATAEAERIEEIAPGHRHGADPFFGTAKLSWLREVRPEVFARTERVLTANGFIVQRLTGIATLDDSSAALLQGFDDATGAFDARLARHGVPTGLLAPIHPSTALVGEVTDAAAAATGIAAGTPVAAGGIDAIGSALEAGALEIGDPLVEMIGFSSVTMLTAPRGVHVPGFIHTRHCVPGVDLLITAQVTAGATIDWVNTLAGSGTDLRAADGLRERARPSRLTCVPALAGERTPSWNPSTRGLIDGLDLSTDGVELMLAAMEGNAMALATDVAVLSDHGFTIQEMLATGGGSASDVWMQITADVLGIPVTRPRTGHGAAHGAAFLAGLAIGSLSLERIRERTSDPGAPLAPEPVATRAYAQRLPRFEHLLQSARDRGLARA